ncbi:hypothetical protein C8R44DRAFT_808369 [Mycena epipterygia]|nr:hypothetical protein C8R44DRAFT_808369 [Mycena epipterygia]
MPHLNSHLPIIPRYSTGLELSSTFFGCTAEAEGNVKSNTNDTITKCCTQVGSTATTANGSFGCP